MEINAFSIARLPKIIFGDGCFDQLPALCQAFGSRILLVTGQSAFENTEQWTQLRKAFAHLSISWDRIQVSGEPSPTFVDQTVAEWKGSDFQAVVAIGGGSVMDAAKAIAGLLPLGTSVMDYLEGVGPELPYTGPALPFIAVPTTAGTGSEATKNAVLSVAGKKGFKKSFRDEQLVAQIALVDPELLQTCPKALIAANGMDALTQLLESYVSIRSNPFTDALALSGLTAVRDGLIRWYQANENTAEARAKMAYASLLSGITLAQTGLGSVHGLASPLGAFFPIPHGVVCGTLVATATEINVRAMRDREPENPAIGKYANVGRLLCAQPGQSDPAALSGLVHLLQAWTETLDLPKLAGYGVQTKDIEVIVANSRGSSMKTNPIVLSDEEISELISLRI